MRFSIRLCAITITVLISSTVVVASDISETDQLVSMVDVRSTNGWKNAGTSHFTGKVFSKAAFRQPAPARGYGAYVKFTPGARTHWHMHPTGQTLIVIDGLGLTQYLDKDGNPGPIVEIRSGNIVVCPPGVTHWHGASAGQSMTHLAISERDPKSSVQWFDPVSEKQYSVK